MRKRSCCLFSSVTVTANKNMVEEFPTIILEETRNYIQRLKNCQRNLTVWYVGHVRFIVVPLKMSRRMYIKEVNILEIRILIVSFERF